jgi:nucleoside-diphosphate-sugar epimerase
MTAPKQLVLVTGSSGFIGRATAKRLSQTYRVVGLDGRTPRKFEDLEEFVPTDFGSDSGVADALDHVRDRYGKSVASVIHFASYHDFSGEPSPLYDEVTVLGTTRLLDGLRQFEVDQLVYSSTMLVHAPTEPGRPIDESSALEAKWDHPRSKLEAEAVIARHPGPMQKTILRIGGVYDDWCNCQPIANQIQRIYERKLVSHLFPGDTSHGQAFMHLDDLTELIERIVRLRTRLGRHETFLVAEPVTPSYEELQQAIAKALFDASWTTETIPKAVAKAGAWIQDQVPGEEPFIKPWMIDIADDHFEIDISHARKELGFALEHDLLSEIPAMIERLEADPVAWYRENDLELPSFLEEPASGTSDTEKKAEAS